MTDMRTRRGVGILALVGGSVGLLGGAWAFAQGVGALIGPVIRIWVLSLTTLFDGSADSRSVLDAGGVALPWLVTSFALFWLGWGAILAGINSLGHPRPTEVSAEES